MMPLLIAASVIASTPDLGKVEAQCRPGEQGPALLISVAGLKDRQGRLKLEVYPSNDRDFLADDNVLVSQGKVFRRVEMVVPADRTPAICVRIPGPGAYSVALLHDRDSNRKFGLSTDGIGFTANPKLGLSKPKAAAARIVAGRGLTRAAVTLNYRQGLLGFSPVKSRNP